MCAKRISNVIQPRMSQTDLFSGLYLAESSQLVASGRFSDLLLTDYELRMYFTISGKGIFRQGHKNFPVKQNDVYFQTKGIPASFHTNGQPSLEMYWIDLYGKSIAPLLQLLGVTAFTPLISGISHPRFAHEMKAIVKDYDNLSSADNMSILSSLYRIFSILLDANDTTSKWQKVPHQSGKILYTGNWKIWPSPSVAVKEETYTAEAKAYAEFNFTGTGIKWYGTMNFDCGKADVIIDGNYRTTVDCYSPDRLSKQLLYINTKLSEGAHIIKIFCCGEKNPKATNFDVVVESFQYYCPEFADDSQVLHSQDYSTGSLSRQIEDYIKSNYQKDISVQSISEIFGVSRSYLTSKFSSEIGMSPSQYLIRVRMEKAKEYLLGTGMPIAVIAVAVGYNDAFYFSRFFKKCEKMSPTKFRQANQKSNTERKV